MGTPSLVSQYGPGKGESAGEYPGRAPAGPTLRQLGTPTASFESREFTVCLLLLSVTLHHHLYHTQLIKVQGVRVRYPYLPLPPTSLPSQAPLFQLESV